MLLIICYINLCATMILLLGDLDGMAFVLSLGQCYLYDVCTDDLRLMLPSIDYLLLLVMT